MKSGSRCHIRPLRLFLFLAVCAACLISCTNAGSSSGFSRKIKQIDSIIAGGDKKRAEKALASLRSSAKSSEQWLSIAKRERSLGGYSQAVITLRAAMKSLPANESLTAVMTDTLTELGRYPDASPYASALANTRYAALAAYVVIQRSLSADGVYPDPVWWERAYAASGNPTFRRNAAVLYAGAGNYAAACNLYGTDGTATNPDPILADGAVPEPVTVDTLFSALLFYDGGFYDRVLTVLPAFDDGRLTPEMLALLADTAWKKNDTGFARSLWTAQTVRTPVSSPLPYYNLAVTADSPVDARKSLETCLSFFPSWYPAVVRYVRSVPEKKQVASNDPVTSTLEKAGFMTLEMEAAMQKAPVDADKAEKILSSAIAEHTPAPDVRFRIEALRFARLRDLDVARSVAEMWKLLETYKKNPVLYTYAAWYFASTGNYEASFSVNHANPAGPDPFYLGMEEAFSGDLDKAVDEFALVANSQQNAWAALADTACIYAKKQDYGRAAETVIVAAGMAPDDRIRSRLHYTAATYLLSMHSPDRVKNELGYALELDPSNYRAGMLLRRLETEKNGTAEKKAQ